MKRWCRVYECSREAAEGSDFCRVKHGWWEPEPATVPAVAPVVVVVPPLEPVLMSEGRDAWFDIKEIEPPVLMRVRDCVGCEQTFEQEIKPGKPFSYCETCRGIAA